MTIEPFGIDYDPDALDARPAPHDYRRSDLTGEALGRKYRPCAVCGAPPWSYLH